jgi:hypothetical protein
MQKSTIFAKLMDGMALRYGFSQYGLRLQYPQRAAGVWAVYR